MTRPEPTTVVDPFPADDPLAYDELTPTWMAWRAALAALATTGAALDMPANLCPPFHDLEIAAGWRLRWTYQPDPDRKIITITATWADAQAPTWPADIPPRQCAGPALAADRRRTTDVACRGNARWAVSGHTTTAITSPAAPHRAVDTPPMRGPFGPLCEAHAQAEGERLRDQNLAVQMVNTHLVVLAPGTRLLSRNPQAGR